MYNSNDHHYEKIMIDKEDVYNMILACIVGVAVCVYIFIFQLMAGDI